MHDVAHLLGVLAVALRAAAICGWLAQRIGQPAVLGELIAGVVLGGSVLALVDPHDVVLHFVGEVGVVILLFQIGLETDLTKLLKVGPASFVVASVGVAVPFGLGYAVCLMLGLEQLVAIVAGAVAHCHQRGNHRSRSVGSRRLHDAEGQIILGAAVIDDVIGLVILTVVSAVAAGGEINVASVGWIAAAAFGFLFVVVGFGILVVPRLARG